MLFLVLSIAEFGKDFEINVILNRNFILFIELRCSPGYSFDLQSNACINIRECDFGVCEEDADCIDTEGSFRCVCPPGFTLNADGLTCSGNKSEVPFVFR